MLIIPPPNAGHGFAALTVLGNLNGDTVQSTANLCNNASHVTDLHMTDLGLLGEVYIVYIIDSKTIYQRLQLFQYVNVPHQTKITKYIVTIKNEKTQT